jgi:hypothetical protein
MLPNVAFGLTGLVADNAVNGLAVEGSNLWLKLMASRR